MRNSNIHSSLNQLSQQANNVSHKITNLLLITAIIRKHVKIQAFFNFLLASITLEFITYSHSANLIKYQYELFIYGFKKTIQRMITIVPYPNIYISGNTCVCLAELFWYLIHRMQYFEMYMIKWSHFLEGDGLGHTLKSCLTTCYIKLRVKIHHHIFTEITHTL